MRHPTTDRVAPQRHALLTLLGVCCWLCCATPGDAANKETFSIDYIVTIRAGDTGTARVRWELSGIEEIKHLRLRFESDDVEDLRGTGILQPDDKGLRWIPGGPYAHLSYRIPINRERGESQRYDSYAADSWIVTRARRIFPRIDVTWDTREGSKPKSRARLIFRLPNGWQSAAAHERTGKHVYRLQQAGTVLDRPRGWYGLGELATDRQEIAGIMLRFARVGKAPPHSSDLFEFLAATLPRLRRLLRSEAERILIVCAPDPMWRGGISGENSMFVHSGRRLRTPDKTSPYLHELFHVLQPFRVAEDADWVGEGLAEFYSVELQRRAGAVDADAFERALRYFEKYGEWNVDLRKQKDNAATNNSAPLVMYAIDQRIQKATAGKKRLDDVVLSLTQEERVIDTALFRRTVDTVSGKWLRRFFDKHVVRGIPPRLDNPA
jgi:hypothetical protein